VGYAARDARQPQVFSSELLSEQERRRLAVHGRGCRQDDLFHTVIANFLHELA
jgi:hypothetical protein